VACFAEGTRIRTPDGERAVEHLRVGEMVLSAFGGAIPVCWLGHRLIDCRRHPTPREVMPVRVCANAFAPGVPSRDLLLSPDHAVYCNDRLIPVRYLVNGASIAQEEVDTVTYWHIELPAHDVIFAEKLACESYLDTGNRAAFANPAGAAWETESRAPMAVDGDNTSAAN
jgi:collagen type I alpha